MGVTAENVAAQCGVSRQQQDAFASQSQAKAAAAQRVRDRRLALLCIQGCVTRALCLD